MTAGEAVPRNEFSDLYNEVGPDNVGGMGNEPSCCVTLYTLKRHTEQPPQSQQALHQTTAADAVAAAHTVTVTDNVVDGSSATIASDCADATEGAAAQQPVGADLNTTAGSGPSPPAVLPLSARLARQAVKSRWAGMITDSDDEQWPYSVQEPVYEAVEQVDCGPHKVVAVRYGQQEQLLLGLSDDVDCAVVQFSSSHDHQLQSQHIHSIPALAYVAAGSQPICTVAITHA